MCSDRSLETFLSHISGGGSNARWRMSRGTQADYADVYSRLVDRNAGAVSLGSLSARRCVP